ncbi:MAG: energy transducer TonB [Candidatus Sulfotelmatobacter sp.]
MIETLQLEEPVELHDAPRLLVEWSSPWQEFVASIRPALARSDRRLAGEAPFGLIPLRVMVPSYLVEAFLIFAAIAVQIKIAELRPFVAPRFSSHDVIYYSGDELPRTEDLGGAEAGTTGRAGGDEAHHRTQTIKIARGSSLLPKVVDAPNLKLPSSRDAVANLLAINPNPGPPPSEGLRSTRTAPNLHGTLIAPAPNAIRDYTRNGVQLDGVIAPAPSVQRDQPLTAPTFNAAVIPPAPNASRERTLVAPVLVPAVIPPAPNVSRESTTVAPSLSTAVVAPAPSLARDLARSTPELATSAIPPSPTVVTREFSRSPVQMTNGAVVPPPVSAPERATARNPKLALPPPSVIAPPPSADVSQDMHRLAGGNIPDSSKAVVPPPPTQSGGGSFMSSLIGKVFGATEVVPPPPTVNSNGPSSGSGTSLAANVVPPPPAVGASTAGGNPRGVRSAMGASPGSNVVAPPPSTGVSGGTGTRSFASTPTLGSPTVVPPPPLLAGAGGGTGNTSGGAGAIGGTLLANNLVPPPPSLGGGSGPTGSGLGRKGTGLGAPSDAGSNVAPPSSGGSGHNAGAVISSQPGPKVGLPTNGGAGSLAMSPSGGDKPGLGGAGGGTGIGHGNGPGSGMNGAGTGAGKSGPGRGSDPSARGGISPAGGPGGAGNVPSGTPAVRGVDISGGSSVVTLPGFGSDSSASAPQAPGHSSVKPRQTLGVTIVATASSGGAFEPYKNLLRGEKYTTYFDTSLGTVVMEFADEAATDHPYGGTLIAPTAIRTDLDPGLPQHTRMVVACTLDASGNLKNVRVLEAGPADMTSKILTALHSWKFQPAVRGERPVEVTAILGFGVDTNDHF